MRLRCIIATVIYSTAASWGEMSQEVGRLHELLDQVLLLTGLAATTPILTIKLVLMGLVGIGSCSRRSCESCSLRWRQGRSGQLV